MDRLYDVAETEDLQTREQECRIVNKRREWLQHRAELCALCGEAAPSDVLPERVGCGTFGADGRTYCPNEPRGRRCLGSVRFQSSVHFVVVEDGDGQRISIVLASH